MPYIDIRESQYVIAMVQTVRNNFEGFSNNQDERAILDCKVQEIIGHPADTNLKHMVSKNLLINFPVKVGYVTNALSVFSHTLSGVRGKTMRTKLD